jgi:O-antigen ligase
MNTDIINYVFPPLVFFLFLFFCRENKSNSMRLCALFFTSIPCFSQNFSFVFRELHQLVQLILLFFLVVIVLKNGKALKVFYFPIFFLFVVFLSLIGVKFDHDARIQLINIIVTLSVTGFLYLSIKSEEQLKVILHYIGQLAVFVSVSGIIEYALGISTRVEGSFANPNYFALFIGVGWVLVYCYFSKFQKNIALPVMTLAIILSGSRAALIFPILVVLWQFYVQGSVLKIFIYGSFTGLLLFVIYLSGATRINMSEMSGSDAERFLFSKIAINMAVENPISGVGWGRYISEFSSYASSVEPIKLESGVIDVSKQGRRVTHNDLLKILAELGFIVFFICVIFILKTFYLILKYKGFGRGYLFPCWCGLILFSLTHNNLNTAYSWFFLLLPWFIYFKQTVVYWDSERNLLNNRF